MLASSRKDIFPDHETRKLRAALVIVIDFRRNLKTFWSDIASSCSENTLR